MFDVLDISFGEHKVVDILIVVAFIST